jgi:hypothetical protein
VLRIGADRLLLKLRSYLNADFPAELPHVLEIPRVELNGAGVTRMKLGGEDRSGSAVSETVVFLDLHLHPSVDTLPLEEVLRRERELRHAGAAWRHYPVTLVGERTLRIEWRSRHSRTTPSIQKALRLLGASLQQRDEQLDLGGPTRKPVSPDVAQEIRSLAQQGRILEATMLAERALDCTTAEARQLVGRLSDHRLKGGD